MNSKDLLHHYRRTYYARYQREYPVVWKRHGAQAKRLLALYSPEDLTKYIELYVNSYRDKFHVEKGKPFDLFVTALPALINLASEEQLAKERVGSNESNYERLRSARGKSVTSAGESSDRSELGQLPFLPQAKVIRNGDGN